MTKQRNLQHLSDDALVARLGRLTQRHRVATVELLAHIAEMDARKLFRLHACSSMFAYATTRLGLAESSAYKQIHVGRLARRFPVIFDLLEAGDVHLSNLLLLAPRLSEENHQELLSAVRRKSRRQVEQLLAERFPKPPVPARIRKLPTPRVEVKSETPAQVTSSTSAANPTTATALPLTSMMPAPTRPGRVEPLAPARFRVELTADQEMYDNIEKAKALLGPRLAGSELSELFGLALRRLVEDLERTKFAKTPRPRRAPDTASPSAPASTDRSRHIPNHVKREVVARDGAQCAFVDKNGNRCQESWGLEFDHSIPFARDGLHTTENTRLLCKPHNDLMAEQTFGAEYIAAKKKTQARGRPGPASQLSVGSTD